MGALVSSNAFLEHHVDSVPLFWRTWSILGAILAATGFRRAIPLGVEETVFFFSQQIGIENEKARTRRPARGVGGYIQI